MSRFTIGRLRGVIIPAAVALASALALTLGALDTGAAGASILSHRPGANAAGPAATTNAIPGFSPFAENFETSAGNFCDNAADAPCDGNAAAGDYGTADGSIPVSFSDFGYGNYAQHVTRLTTSKGFIGRTAILSGSTAANQGNACPTAGTEGCTGPYLEPRGQNQYAFPVNGYTLTAYMWVDPSYTSATGSSNGAGTQFDTDLGIDQSTGVSGGTSYGQDEVITTCNSGGAASVSFGNGSPGTCGNGGQITAAGWYRYVFVVSSQDGNVSVTARVLTADGSQLLFDSGPQPVSFGGPQATTANTGGMRYLWFPTLNEPGLRMAFARYQSGQHLNGAAA